MAQNFRHSEILTLARETGKVTVEELARFRDKIKTALSTPGPHFICAQVEALDTDRPPRVRRLMDPRENKYQFAGYIQRTEGVEILGSGLGGG